MRRRHAANRRHPRSLYPSSSSSTSTSSSPSYFCYWFSGLPPLWPIRGMCQQATIKRLMAISLYAPISVIQYQVLPHLARRRTRRRRPGHMFVVITCELTRRSVRGGAGSAWPRDQVTCPQFGHKQNATSIFFPLTLSYERVNRVYQAAEDSSKYYTNIRVIYKYHI